MANDSTIFAFEKDFAGALYCIPMAVRRKLDLCGVKVSLKQWNKFALEERERLVARGCETQEETDAYQREVAHLIQSRAGDTPQFLDREAGTEWKDATTVPQRLIDYCNERGVPATSPAQWAALTELQRFTLFKLTRPGHTNENFIPALREFGLIA
jgi:hypothetical protein